MKKIFFFIFLLLTFIYPQRTFATTVTNRPDGTFLLNGQPYFPIGFSPQSLVYNVPESDWQDLKNSGINFTNDGNNPYRFNELNNKLKAQGLNVTIISYGPIHSPFDATTQSNLAKNENNFLGYYGLDEPPVYDPPSSERQTYYQTIFQNDPNHFIWTNHYAYDRPYLPDFDQNFWEGIKRWDILTRSSVTGADIYSSNWEAVGSITGLHKGFAAAIVPQLQAIRPGINTGVMMILSGYNRLWGVELPPLTRLNSTIDAIIHGANGFMFYFDNADYILDNYYESGVTKPSWITDSNWTKYRNSSAYNEIKQIASFLKEAYPGLTGTINSSITANFPILAKNGTDNRLYLFMANENPNNDLQASIQGLPANTNFYEIISKRNVPSSQLSSFTLPKYSTQIYVQGTPSPTATPIPSPCIIQGYKRMMPGNINNTEPVKSQTITISGTGGGTFTNNPYINNVANGTHTVSTSIPQNYKVGYTLCYNRINCHNDQPIMNSSVEVSCNGGYVDLWWHYYKKIDIVDLRNFLTNFLKPLTIFDYNKLVENFGK